MTTKQWSIINLINWSIKYFQNNNISNARKEIEWILCEILNCERIDLYLNYNQIVKQSRLDKIKNMLKRRVNGEPFQYIIERSTFYGRDFFVNKDVLIPRPETEVLIERLKTRPKCVDLIDVGTGSGCIAITCALEEISENIFATDISKKALNIAKHNVDNYKLNNIQFANHNILTSTFKTKFDVMVSNPPYISQHEMITLQNDIINHEPHLALTDGEDGLTFYKHFSKLFSKLIKPSGIMLLEIGGAHQKKDIISLFPNSKYHLTFLKDLNGAIRAVEIKS